MSKSAVFESTTSPVPITEYKAKIPPTVSGYINKLKSMAAAAARKAKLMTATILEKLNLAGIRKLINGVLAARNAIVSAVAGAVSWVKSIADTVKFIVNDITQGLKNLADDLANLVKKSGIYQLANKVCAGMNLDDLAADIESIQTQIDFDKSLDYALSAFDGGLFNGIKNCSLFDKDSLNKVKDAIGGMFDSSNVMMLDCMKDTVDYMDISAVDRKLKSAAQGMTDDPDNAAALAAIAAYMDFFQDFLMTTRDLRFNGVVLYNMDDVMELQEKVPNYVKTTIGSDKLDLLVAANAILV